MATEIRGPEGEIRQGPVREDRRVNVKIKLSALWTALVFFYLYNDVISFFRRDTIEGVLAGELGGIEITPLFLFGIAALLAIPIFMVFLSLTLPARANRWTNISLGVFHLVVLLATLFVPAETFAHYALYMFFEGVFIALIIWHAWKWPTQERTLT